MMILGQGYIEQDTTSISPESGQRLSDNSITYGWIQQFPMDKMQREETQEVQPCTVDLFKPKTDSGMRTKPE